MHSNPAHELFFYFRTRKYFIMLFKFLDFLRSLDRFKVLKVIISDYYLVWRKKFNEMFTSHRGGRLSTPCPDGVDIAYVQTG